MAKVKLVSYTKGVGELENLSVGELLAYAARVSNPDNQMNHETAPKLLSYCLRNKHWSVFETCSFTIEVTTSRAIAAQILRHRSLTFQEFCISGDTEIYFDLPHVFKKDPLKPKRALYKLKIADIYRKWNENTYKQNQMKSMNIRVYDEQTKLFTNSHITDVFCTGEKDVYKVTLENGKSIKCTKEHKLLTLEGFKTLEEAVGLTTTLKGRALMSKVASVGCNGIPVHQDYTWLKDMKEKCILNKTGVQGIADQAKVSYHTIRKWLRLLGLQFAKKETSSMYDVWNKGKFGYRNPPISEEVRQKMRDSSKKGADSHLWRGGADRSWRLKVCDELHKYRRKFLEAANFKCPTCDGKENLQLHHIISVAEKPELALDHSNIQVLCRSCHYKLHGQQRDHIKWRGLGTGRTLKTTNYCKVKSVEYIGKEMTYDLEVDHTSHNYVANGMVVHNSQRYSEIHNYEVYEARRQDTKNRQNSIDDLDTRIKEEFVHMQNQVADVCFKAYKHAISLGIAKEQARFLLPNSTQTRMYITGNIRSWLTYCLVRCTEATQKEHRDIAEDCKNIILDFVPELCQCFESD